MTKSKIIRLINELIEKYGDIEVVRVYDYYKSRLIGDNDRYIPDEECVVGTLTISQIGSTVENRHQYEVLEEIVKWRRSLIRHWIEVPESKEKYLSEEQTKLRKKHRDDFRRYMGILDIPYRLKEYDTTLKSFDNLMEPKMTPRKFGMAMDNYKKKH